jgi:colicin import membrane protein
MDAERRRAIIGSLLVHLTLVGIVAFTMWERPSPPAVAQSQPLIQARAVDEATAMEPVRRREAEEQRKKEAAAAEKRRQAEEQRQKAEAEKQRQLAEQKKKAEAEQKKKVEAEQQRQSELKRKQEAARAAEETKRLAAAEQRQKEEAAKKRKEEEEVKRKASEEKLKQALAAEDARLREEESRLSAQRTAGMVNKYLSDITRKVRGNWLRLPGMPQDFSCKVWVKQIPSGQVVDVRIMESSGNVMLDRSVEAAVWKASPLPAPPSPEVFDREVIITFVPR